MEAPLKRVSVGKDPSLIRHNLGFCIRSKSLALHLHHLIHRRHHALVEMAHDPDRTANDERDDQNAEGQRQHVVSIVRRGGKMEEENRCTPICATASTASAIGMAGAQIRWV